MYIETLGAISVGITGDKRTIGIAEIPNVVPSYVLPSAAAGLSSNPIVQVPNTNVWAYAYSVNNSYPMLGVQITDNPVVQMPENIWVYGYIDLDPATVPAGMVMDPVQDPFGFVTQLGYQAKFVGYKISLGILENRSTGAETLSLTDSFTVSDVTTINVAMEIVLADSFSLADTALKAMISVKPSAEVSMEPTIWSDIHPEFAIASDGDIKIVKNVQAVYGSIENILLTIFGSRVMMRDFAAKIHGLLFEAMVDTAVRQHVVDELKKTIELYDDRVQIRTLELLHDSDNSTMKVHIEFWIKGYENTFTMDKKVGS